MAEIRRTMESPTDDFAAYEGGEYSPTDADVSHLLDEIDAATGDAPINEFDDGTVARPLSSDYWTQFGAKSPNAKLADPIDDDTPEEDWRLTQAFGNLNAISFDDVDIDEDD